jgi:hypothetical protein
VLLDRQVVQLIAMLGSLEQLKRVVAAQLVFCSDAVVLSRERTSTDVDAILELRA